MWFYPVYPGDAYGHPCARGMQKAGILFCVCTEIYGCGISCHIGLFGRLKDNKARLISGVGNVIQYILPPVVIANEYI